jgi:tetratricopeptide (TPR) repeat protein
MIRNYRKTKLKRYELCEELQLLHYGKLRYMKLQDWINLYPDLALAYCNRGNAKNCLEDYKGAIVDLTKAIALDPSMAQAYSNRGLAKLGLEDDNGALADCNKAIELDPDLAEAYYCRGFAKSHFQDYRGAIADFTQIIFNSSGSTAEWLISNAYLGRGLAKVQSSDINGACLDWKKAGKLGSETAYELIKANCN